MTRRKLTCHLKLKNLQYTRVLPKVQENGIKRQVYFDVKYKIYAQFFITYISCVLFEDPSHFK